MMRKDKTIAIVLGGGKGTRLYVITSYSIHYTKLYDIELNRKALSNMAIEDKAAFSALVAQVKVVLEK